jgi:hypothetical protein
MADLADLATVLVVCPAQFLGQVLAGLPDGRAIWCCVPRGSRRAPGG